MQDTTRFVKVFIPYNQYNHVAYCFYYTDELGELPFGTFVRTSLGVGVIIEENIPRGETFQYWYPLHWIFGNRKRGKNDKKRLVGYHSQYPPIFEARE